MPVLRTTFEAGRVLLKWLAERRNWAHVAHRKRSHRNALQIAATRAAKDDLRF